MLFQYISCCSLSGCSLNHSALLNCFNTSHVVVYPVKHHPLMLVEPRFNTSHVVVYHIPGASKRHGNPMFQYISCCSLSMAGMYTLTGIRCFNTSHVVVYLHNLFRLALVYLVSIHLML